MRIRSSGRIFPLILAIILCMCAPFEVAHIGDRLTDGKVWAVERQSGYRYAGTFENRVQALNAYTNASPHVIKKRTSETEAVVGYWKDLTAAGLLPESRKAIIASSEHFILSSERLDAEYEYIYTVSYAEGETLSVTCDAATGRPIRIELTGAREAMAGWSREDWRLLNAYIAYLGYEGEAEAIGSYGDMGAMTALSAMIPGTYLQVTLVIVPPLGMIAYSMLPAE